MVETKGCTLEEVAMVFDPSTTSLVDTRLLADERDASIGGKKARDLEDQK
jgi:hypothetical protein